MDRFSEESAAALARQYYARRRNLDPFFVELEPCENCGAPCEERKLHEPSGLMIGTRCLCSPEPVENVCADYIDVVQGCKFVSELQRVIAEHKAICPFCNPQLRKEVQSETQGSEEERREA